MEKEKKKRKNVMVGAYLPPHVKEFLKRRADARYTTLSEIIKEILLKEMAKENENNN